MPVSGRQRGPDTAPVDEEVPRRRVEKREPRDVRRLNGLGVNVAVQRACELVRREDVAAAVADIRRRVSDRVEDLLNAGRHSCPPSAAAEPDSSRRGGVRSPGQIEHMLTFGVVKLQSLGHRVQHRFRHTGEVSPFEAGVVDDADAREGRHLLAPKTGHPTVTTERSQPCLLLGQPRTARGEELTNLAPVSTGITSHAFDRRPIPNRLGATTVIPHAVTPSCAWETHTS